MKTSELLLTGLDINEDEYNFKAQFILNAPGKSKGYDINDLESESKLSEIKSYFNLDESQSQIKSILMEMIMEKAHISSSIIEGENFEEASKKKSMNRLASTLDMS